MLKKSLFVSVMILFITGCINPTPQTTQNKSEIATLKLNSHGHTSMINDIIVTKYGEIITASDDKTIRVWDSNTGKEKQKILGEIGNGKSGMIYAIALSSNEQFLAVGVEMNSGDEETHKGIIRIYNYQTGVLEKVIEAHNKTVLDLAFSADGHYLISGAKDNLVKIWSVNSDFALLDTIKFHTNYVYGVKIIKKGDDYYALSVSDDGQIALYSLRDKEVIKSDKKTHSLNFLATNEKNIAVCGFNGGKIWIYDFDLNPIKTINSKTQPNGLAYSPNGEFLIAGVGREPNRVTIYSTKDYKEIGSFKKHDNLVLAVGFLDNKTAISAGGENNEIYIWDIATQKVKQKIEGVGAKIWSVGVSGDEVAWGNKWSENYGKSPLEKSLNLKNPKKTGIRKSGKGFKQIATKQNGMELIPKKGGEYGYKSAILVLKKDGKEIEIERDALNGYKHNCFGFYKNYIVSGGANGVLKIYNLDGDEVANLLGHNGEIWALALDGDRLVSGGADQTIRVWDLSKLKEIIYPQLNIFVSKDRDWVIWTPQGFFDSSKGGAEYIGYHINQGLEREAKFVSVDRLYNLFYRPDLIQKALNGEDLNQYLKRDIETVLSEGGVAPTLKIVDKENSNGEVRLKIRVCDNGGGVANLKVYLNGTAVNRITKAFRPRQSTNRCYTITKIVRLVNGTNQISVQATNAKDTVDSNTESITISYHSQKAVKPNLHILTLSINNYEDKNLTLNYANNDSDAITKKLKEIGKKVFAEVYSYQLKDKNVTMSNILKEFKTISQKITSEDTFVLFLSGHGTMEGGVYHFIPFDCHNSDSVTKKALSQKSLLDALADIPAYKSVVLLDTCQSGGFEEGLASTVIEKFGTRSGRAILSASTKTQNAIEGYENHGVFTHTLLEAMNNPKVYNYEDKLSVTGVAHFVKKELPKKTMKKWKYLQNAKFFKDNSDVEIILGGR